MNCEINKIKKNSLLLKLATSWKVEFFLISRKWNELVFFCKSAPKGFFRSIGVGAVRPFFPAIDGGSTGAT